MDNPGTGKDAMRKLSQREARRIKKRVGELELRLKQQRDRWSSDWGPDWVNIETLTLTPESFAKIKTARLLGHAVILLPHNGTQVLVYADRL
jgi:hypothetical protein